MATLDRNRWLAVSPYLDRALEMGPAELSTWLGSLRSEEPSIAVDLEMLLGDLEESRREKFLEDPVGNDLLPTMTPDRAQGVPDESSPFPRVSDHEVLRLIGRGSYGGIWLARNATGQLRAVKVVWRKSFSSERPYEREFKGVQQFEPISRSHPGVMEVLHIGRDTEAGYFYYVMELADPVRDESTGGGGVPISPAGYEPRTLASDLKSRGRLPLPEVLTLGVHLADALGHLHRNRLIHRDVKPSNVIYVGGQAKLADIGLVTGTDEAKSFVGTEGFIPPEGPGTPRADIFALGRLLYQAATGKDRCEFPDLPDDLDAWSDTERSALLELHEVLARACAPIASHRHDSAEKLAGDFNLLLAGRSVPRAYRVGLWSRRAQKVGRAAGAALRTLGRGWVGQTREARAFPKIASIAVLPFVNRSASAEDEYFSDGLADELLNLLAKIDGLRVAARTSAFQFKGKDTSLAEIGRALNVDTILEGSVHKAGSRVRISVRLLNVAHGYHLWSDTYDRDFEDLFAVQDDIAQSVVGELRTKLLGLESGSDTRRQTEADVARAAKGRSTDPQALRIYLLARHLNDRFNPDDTVRAIEYLREALERDPRFAFAWAELSRAYSNQANHGWAPAAEGYERSRDAAERALALEPDLAEGHSAIGWVRMLYDWDWRGAQASFARALQLAPGNALVLRRAGALAENLGRLDEGIALCRRAVEQDPLNPGSYRNLGKALLHAARFAESEQVFRQARDLAPRMADAHADLALAMLAQGREDEALAEASCDTNAGFRNCALAIIHHVAGRRVESDQALRELVTEHGEAFAFQIAEVHATRGETDRAFEWLGRAYDLRDTGLSEVKTSPWLRSLHGDPRWVVFIKTMGLDGVS